MDFLLSAFGRILIFISSLVIEIIVAIINNAVSITENRLQVDWSVLVLNLAFWICIAIALSIEIALAVFNSIIENDDKKVDKALAQGEKELIKQHVKLVKQGKYEDSNLVLAELDQLQNRREKIKEAKDKIKESKKKNGRKELHQCQK